MAEETLQKNETTTAAPAANTPGYGQRSSGGSSREFTKNRRQPRRRMQRPKPEFEQKILDIRRVTRVSSGGRRFSFSVAMVIGDKNGRVGLGIGKAGDTSLAIDKAIKNAKKTMFRVTTTKTMSIPHPVSAKFCASEVMIMPAPERGTIAGGAPRDVLVLAGVKDVNAKILSRSKNHLNNAKAAIKALKTLRGVAFVPAKKKEEEVTNN
jgi:small subunit ribosomal protein S5